MTIAALIVAAGRGERAGGDVPKQWQHLAGRMVIEHTLDAFIRAPGIGPVVVVLSKADQGYQTLMTAAGARVAYGGETRSASVINGLKLLNNTGVGKILIHDAARPCISQKTISDVIAALEHADAAAPALAVTDALWTGANGAVTGMTSRQGLYRAQTPQGFDFDALVAASAAFKGAAADDVEVARAAGMTVAIVPGQEDNLKITLPGDFARADRILRAKMDIRTGNGFDVHRFEPGDHVILCGVRLAHDMALKGHSDADVGMHALTDAIYGAMAKGDIGRHFPPSDPQWKGAASKVFLAHAADLARSEGFEISNVDVTLICEYPKITPHSDEMRRVLASVTGLNIDRVSVKATTSEGLGFTGRGEGIAAMATATLVRS